MSGTEARTAATPTDLEPLPAGRLGLWLATFDAGYFAAVMATGIVCIGAALLGHAVISDVLLWCTVVAFVLLWAAYLTRAIRVPRRFATSLTNPSTAVTYFTLVAGTNVLATAVLLHGLWLVALNLGSTKSARLLIRRRWNGSGPGTLASTGAASTGGSHQSWIVPSSCRRFTGR